MKSIYVTGYQKQRKHQKWPYIMVFFLAILLVTAKFAAPFVAENWINEKGSEGKGYHYRVGDVSLNILKGEVNLRDLKVFSPMSMINLAEAPKVELQFQWADIFRGDHIFNVKADQLNFILSKSLFDEIQRIKDQANNSSGAQLYLDKIVAKVKRINIIEADETNSRTILTLTDSKVSGKDIAVGDANPKTEFSFDGKIAEGGKIDLKGKTTQNENNAPWMIQGQMTNIEPDVLEKLTGDKLPIDISKTKLNADIVAHSQEGQIKGTLTPDIKEFNLREEKKTQWGDTVVKVRNYDLEKTPNPEEVVRFEIPFTVSENLNLNIDETVNKVKSQVKSKILAL